MLVSISNWVCETYSVDETDLKSLQIEKPEGCEVTSENLYFPPYDMRCPNFRMKMEEFYFRHHRIDSSTPLREELRSTVECPNDSRPYEYLRSMKSERNSLILEDCPPPEHGSFSDGWPNLEMLKFNNFGNQTKTP